MALSARTKLERLTKLRPTDPDYAIFQAGVEYGGDQLKKKALGFLQARYMADDAPDRDTPEAAGMLKLARELSEELNK